MILMAFIIIQLSCQKKFLCPDCETNKPPVARAGSDQIITLPKDSTVLDGSASSDADGSIVAFEWTKISGPPSSNIITPNLMTTVAKSLEMGVYQFELTIRDNGGLSAKDTVQIIIDNAAVNQPPVACANPDVIITLPSTSVTLNASCSADPDNNIVAYSWTKISGPPAFTIVNANDNQTLINGLILGVYQFELKVTDAGGLFSKDTVKVTVKAATTAVACASDNRSIVNASLIRVGSLSEPRALISVAATGNKVLFNGGVLENGEGSSKVDIYDITTNSWSVAERPLGNIGPFGNGGSGDYAITTATAGSKVFFAGGINLWGSTDYPANILLIYDASTNTWDSSQILPGLYVAATPIGNKVLFAGGIITNRSTKVDIYNVSNNSWSSASLTDERMHGHAALSVNNKAYIIGGRNANGFLSTIDIYDNATNAWSRAILQKEKTSFGAVAVNDKIYLAGGQKHPLDDASNTCDVEIIDVNTGSSIIESLSQPAKWNIHFGQNIVVKDNKIIFLRFDGGANANNFDIYNINTKSWSIGVLPQAIPGEASVISINNTIYIAGGFVNGTMSDAVWKLEL